MAKRKSSIYNSHARNYTFKYHEPQTNSYMDQFMPEKKKVDRND